MSMMYNAVFRMPNVDPYFAGRKEELERINACFMAPDIRISVWPTRILALVGAAGIGKTQLAYEFAYRYIFAWFIVVEKCENSRFAARFTAVYHCNCSTTHALYSSLHGFARDLQQTTDLQVETSLLNRHCNCIQSGFRDHMQNARFGIGKTTAGRLVTYP